MDTYDARRVRLRALGSLLRHLWNDIDSWRVLAILLITGILIVSFT